MVYAARHEYCETATDFLLRRTRLAFVDIDAAEAALPRVRPAPDSMPQHYRPTSCALP